MKLTKLAIKRVGRLQQYFLNESDQSLLLHARELTVRRRRCVQVKRTRRLLFALAAEAIHRETGKQLRDVQIAGAFGLAGRRIIEMQTGEGKTLTAVPAVTWLATMGRGCHVVTSNEYLAQRDAESLGPIYARLGLSVGCVTQQSSQDERRSAYACDITFGTASELGFDFLRDRLIDGPRQALDRFGDPSTEKHVHRPFYAAVVDEADSVLIDEASTPLIIGAPTPISQKDQALYQWSDAAAKQLTDSDFILEPNKLSAHLTEAGARNVILRERPKVLDEVGTEQLLEQVERSLVARYVLSVGRDYLIDDDSLVLISSSTGRRLDGRRWQRGLHQAVETKERLEISEQSRTTARVSIQEYFNLYEHLSGMTGTARSAKSELRRFYKLGVRTIPTHRKCRRRQLSARVFRNLSEKHRAIGEEVQHLLKQNRAILIGTPSVEASEALAEHFDGQRLEYQLLNANQDEHESRIISGAGQVGCVTIATNMAGRGTDIEIADEVRAAGGLHVIATEVHHSRRIDRQLEGRCARQGDPGSYQIMVSGEDEIWKSRPVGPTVFFRSKEKMNAFYRQQKALQGASQKGRKRSFKAGRQHRKRLLDAGFDLFLESNEE
ncbi:MAG: hypothetical protein AAF802_03130 [Planctomycetota bacterium]